MGREEGKVRASECEHHSIVEQAGLSIAGVIEQGMLLRQLVIEREVFYRCYTGVRERREIRRGVLGGESGVSGRW